eukprot:TRINITY_DN4080_c0_g1_i4.p1 TRINITY_DN4080_c0_g1~~TRINITY_DN4080_c0_g1_i4.p1  ORF type:complete len:584 (-),score=105.68 TRINITY_DN4080_c0_g1_i4:743-2494(-)
MASSPLSTYENSDASEVGAEEDLKFNDIQKSGKESQNVEGSEVEGATSKWSAFVKRFEFMQWKKKDISDDASLISRLKYSLLCPPHGPVATLFTWSLVIVTIWAASYVILGQVALPGKEVITVDIHGGTVFSILFLLVLAYLGGMFVALVKLPPLLGMLIVGILVNFVPYISVIGEGIDNKWSAALRSAALTIILLRAGLGLDPVALKKLSMMVFRLAFSPCIAESVIVAVASHYMLGFPWKWGFMLGFVLAAVSPAVVVPCLLSLQERGYGVAKGIPTLVIAAASMDDVLAISAFTILLGVTFTDGESTDIVSLVFKGPKEAVIGILWGIGWGLLMILFPPAVQNPQVNRQANPSPLMRSTLLVAGGLLALLGSAKADVPGAGALAVLTMGFVAGLGWRSQGWEDKNPVCDHLASLWLLFQPLLFGLIGTEIKISELDGSTVGRGIGVLVCGLSVRIVVSYLAVMGGNLTHKERFFISLAWLPKATVQAAVGPLALDLANKAIHDASPDKDMDFLEKQRVLGQQVLAIAVLVILITAPIGAVAVMTAGPKLLEKQSSDKTEGSEMKETESLEKGLKDSAKDE